MRVRRPVAPLSGRPDPEMTQYPAYWKQDTFSFKQPAENNLTDKIMHFPHEAVIEICTVLLWPLKEFKVINLLAGR